MSTSVSTLSYDLARLSSSRSINLPPLPLPSTTINITTNFIFQGDFSVRGRAGGTGFESTLWQGSADLVCRMSAGVGASMVITLTAGLQVCACAGVRVQKCEKLYANIQASVGVCNCVNACVRILVNNCVCTSACESRYRLNCFHVSRAVGVPLKLRVRL